VSHLSNEQLRQWHDAPAEADRAAIAGHLAVCNACADRYTELVRTPPADGEPASLAAAEFIARGHQQQPGEERQAGATSASGVGVAAWWALAAALVLALGVAAWQTLEMRRLRATVVALEAERTTRVEEIARLTREQRTQREQLDRQLAEEQKARAVLEQELAALQREQPADNRRSASPPRPVLSLVLLPGTRDGGQARSITITQRNADVRIMLSLEAPRTVRSYAVNIVDSDGSSVWTLSGIAPGQQMVSVRVPASVLVEDDYELVLTGVDAAGARERKGSYYFTVLK
jgi:hypothetical protein